MHSPSILVAMLLWLLPLDAAAQDAPPAARELQAAAQAMDCAALAAMPNAPMTRDACEAYKLSGLQLAQAMEQTGGAQPGDDAMSCDQIAAELQTMEVAGVSAERAAESQAAGEQLRQAQRQAQTAAAALAARQTAETAVASATGSNAVAGAVMFRQTGEQQALARRAGAQTRDAQSRTTLAVAAATGELAASMQANPRWGHLLTMAGTRCSNHPLFDGSSPTP